jgi:hypothetical protein
MLQIMLLGLLVVAIYLLSHLVVTKVEARIGVPLGHWRALLFFAVFLALTLAAFALLPQFLPAGPGGQAS